jgi:hypothetical protein
VHGGNALLVARYRLAARLIGSSQLSRTWVRSIEEEQGTARKDNLARARERIALRRRVTVWLAPYYDAYTRHLNMQNAPPFVEFSRSEKPFRHFLHFVGCAEVMHLIDDYRWTAGRRRPGMPVTQTALRVMRVWAPLHLCHSEREVDQEFWRRVGRPKFTPASWPPDPADLDARLARVLRRKPAPLREWQEHYNAACAVAVTLTPLSGATGPGRRTQVSLRAVRHLERAVSATDSGSVGNYAQWLSTGDEDLRFLRSTPAFVDFLDRYLPNPALRVPRPNQLLSLVMTFHTLSLVQRYCRVRAEVLGRTDEAAVAERDREPEVREIVRTVLSEDQDWASRLLLIDEGSALCRRHGLEQFGSRLPSFQDDPAAKEYTVRLFAWLDERRGRGSADPDEREFVRRYYDGVLQHRRAQRAALMAAVPGPGDPSGNGYWRDERSAWICLNEVVGQSFLPPDDAPSAAPQVWSPQVRPDDLRRATAPSAHGS